ncbi:hypothetical protein K502DRAFT_327975 [Neoconidiobolus thromboides FSU 785]|nr:hypothetical protein K502DRAFT_327975 [Neoconidiobolus thromboides FSU 785]
MIGPTLPPHLKRRRQSEDGNDEKEKNTDNSPSHQDNSKNKNKSSIGPQLPSQFKKDKQKEEKGQKVTKVRHSVSIGPQMPHVEKRTVIEEPNDQDSEKEESDDGVIGPMPVDPDHNENDNLSRIAREVEARARPQKEQETLKRGEWMTVPPESKLIGNPLKLKARQFRTREVENQELDNSLWTETPQEREERLKHGVIKAKSKPINANPYLEEEKKALKVKFREEKQASLLEMHQSSQNKKGIVDDDPRNRKFDREKDMAVNGLDPKRQAEIVKGSGNLNNRFSHSKGI